MTITDTRAAMSTASINDLDDDQFAYIEPGGTKDEHGRTTPRSKRHFPVHDAAHVRNALARLSSSPFGDKAKAAVHAAAKKFGIDVSDSTSAERDPKWEQRRKRWAGSLIRQPARRNMQMEMRAKPDGTGGTNFEFEGYGAVFDAPFRMFDPWGDEYREVVRPGAFTRSLGNPDLYVPFLIGHNDQGIPLAQTANGTMRLAQDTRGLHVLAQMDGRRTDVRNLAYAVERGDMDQMSIGFVTMGQEWSPDWEQRSMLDLEMHEGDVSSVAIAANRATAGATMTALPAETLARSDPAGEQRGNPVDQDLGDSPDYNPWDHAAPGTLRCTVPGCGALNKPDAKFCDQCGVGGDALVRLDEAGVPAMEEEQGAAATLALRRRKLELLALAAR